MATANAALWLKDRYGLSDFEAANHVPHDLLVIFQLRRIVVEDLCRNLLGESLVLRWRAAVEA